ncbi:Appr-1-p processing protein [Deinococcus multiflagellatus]|uniref:Appr-1-p processing protein n=1 Tax=Deinococcus multiflagellatus TaxID=1656887 RepID=A0ABW1ZV57_9DEIO|nr:Appr-1-p processing protein [Deinococcus multiflagellatus]MBZ9713618.1 Appr-1-p processing protein [Deinococcus multiflagellatus]
MTIVYVTGDATQPQGEGPKLLVHVCNDIGAWGRGFVLALSKRFPTPEAEFKRWAAGETGQPYALGEVQFVPVAPDLVVANLVGQHDIARKSRPTAQPPVRYEAIRAGLAHVRLEAGRLGASVHMPRIGAGVAGGDWAVIAPIIEDELTRHGVPVTVYDLPASEAP